MGRRAPDNQIDWELIEKHYRLGQSTLRQMAAEFKVQPSAISRKAAKGGWTQDKRKEVKALSEQQLLISNASRKATEKATPTRHDIEVAAEVRTNTVLGHRKDIPAARALAVTMLGELRLQTDGLELLGQLGELMRSRHDKNNDKLNDLYHKVISLGGRSSTLKSLAESLRLLVALERQAFGIDAVQDEAPDDAFLKAMRDGRARAANRQGR